MPSSRILRDRVAGQSAMCDVIRAQAEAPPRGLARRILGFSPLTAASRRSYRSALGELLVGTVLGDLGPRWDVLHDLPLRESVLDHLLIGPAGVFAVSAANCGGDEVIIDGETLVVAGQRGGDIGMADAQAREVEHILTRAVGETVRVRPMLVIVNPKRLAVNSHPSTVRVIESAELERVLTRTAATMTGEEVARVSDLADLDATWPREIAGDPEDTQQLHRDFGTIRGEVRVALGRRTLWTLAALGVVCGVIWALTATLALRVVG